MASTFLRALGLNSDTDILSSFYRSTTIQIHDKKLWWQVDDNLIGRRLTYDVANGKKVILPAGRKLTRNCISKFKKAGVTEV